MKLGEEEYILLVEMHLELVLKGNLQQALKDNLEEVDYIQQGAVKEDKH